MANVMIAQYMNRYDCPCGKSWNMTWDVMCDDRCPTCNSSCSPSYSTETVSKSKTHLFQLDLLKSMLNTDLSKMEDRILYQTKAIMANESQHFKAKGLRADIVIFDEYHPFLHIEGNRDTLDNRDKHSWKRVKFKKDTLSSVPSSTKRAKLRSKRKKRK